MRGAYYNETDRYCVEWLRNLIGAGHIPAGDVDDRSIVDVRPGDLRGYTQCHFFAGLGGWGYAARLADWPDDRPLWTGSCPCQPFSVAGKRAGFADERHLWPEWFRLIRECQPTVLAGEQVPAAVAAGWLDLVFDDLEGAGYACGAVLAPAASVGAPHRRERIWFVADAGPSGSSQRRQPFVLEQRPAAERGGWWAVEPAVGRVAHGIPARVAKLRALGNAIVPQVGAEILAAYLGGDAGLSVES